MRNQDILRACYVLGYEQPISIEEDGTVWLGIDPDREYPDMKPILKKAEEIRAQREAAKESAHSKLESLGLTADEIRALLA